MPVNRNQAASLASLAAAIRPDGHRWDEAGIVAAIGRVKELDLAEVAMVVIAGAADRTLETPAAIGNTRSPLWQSGRWRNVDKPVTREPFDPTKTCGDCGQREDRCRANPHSGHEYRSAVETIRNARRGAS